MGLVRSLVANQFRDNPASTTDVLANYFTGEQPTQPNVQPQSTTISYNDDGTVDVTRKEKVSQPETTEAAAPAAPTPAPINLINQQQSPESLYGTMPVVVTPNGQAIMEAEMRPTGPQAAPQRPQPQQAAMPPQQQPQPQARGPVAPSTFDRMVQVESGGRQYDSSGQVLTSPKGAMGIAQVMPETAANPGFGIKPATEAELSTPQGNLAFGYRYYNGMRKYFGGDDEKAVAAYNAGPKAVESAVKQATAEGGYWKDYLPQETKTYLTDVFPKNQQLVGKLKPMFAGGTGITDVGQSPMEQTIHTIALNSGDLQATGLGAYASGNVLDPATRRAYAYENANLLQQQKDQAAAEKRAQTIFTNGGVGLQRALKDTSEEGSYLKAYLFQRLGLADLAKAEQQKLGAGSTWQQTMVGNKPAWVKYNGQGAPVVGFSAKGELTPDELIETQTAKGTTTHTGKMQDVTTGKIYYEQTTPLGVRLVDNQGNIYNGDSANLRAYGIGSDVATKNLIQLQTLRNNMANLPRIEANKYLAKFNAENGTNYAMQDIASMPAMTQQPGQAPATGQPQGGVEANRVQVPQPTAMVQQGLNEPGYQVPPGVATGAPAVAGRPAPGAVRPVAPGQAPVQGQPVGAMAGQPSPTPGVPGAQGIRPPMAGESPAQYAAYKKAAEKQQADLSEGIAKVQLALPQYEATADQILTTLHGVVGTTDNKGNFHPAPGFETNVGVKGITGYLQPPGTAARGWKAKYDQLMGQEFMDSYNNLRGAGAISDAEGKRAVQARAALSDPGISEEDFRKNAKILEDTVKAGVDRQRALVGLPPKYKGVEEEKTTKEEKQTKTIDGVTYEFDGKGWKAKK